MDFKIDGKPVQISLGYDPAKIKKYLETLKDGELLSMESLSAKFGCVQHYLRAIIKNKLPDHYVIVKNKTYCGNVKTVKAYKAL